jgi:hypothetical protein
MTTNVDRQTDAAAVLMVLQELLKVLVTKKVISAEEAKLVASGGKNRLAERVIELGDIISNNGGG